MKSVPILILALASLVAGSACRAQQPPSPGAGAFSWTAESAAAGTTQFTMVSPDVAGRSRFAFSGETDHVPAELFNSRVMSLKAWDTLPVQEAAVPQVCRLLYWRYQNTTPRGAQIPDDQLQSDERDLLERTQWGDLLPALSDRLRPYRKVDWYRRAIQRLLVNPGSAPDQVKTLSSQAREALTAAKTADEAINGLRTALRQQRVARSLSEQFIWLLMKANLARKGSQFGLNAGNRAFTVSLERLDVVLELLSAFAQKLAADDERAGQLEMLLHYADAHGIQLDDDFRAAVRVETADVRAAHDAEYLNLALRLSLEWLAKATFEKWERALAGELVSWVAGQLANTGGAAAAEFVGGAAARLSVLTVGAGIADIAFNISGTYDSLQCAAYCARCADELEKVRKISEAGLRAAEPGAGDLLAWGTSIYLRELSAASYHGAYAELLDGARAAKGGAKLLQWLDDRARDLLKLNHTNDGGVEDAIRFKRDQNDKVSQAANRWYNFSTLPTLISRYAPMSSPTVVSAPVLVIDRSGSLTDQSGVMRQIERNAEEVVASVLDHVSEAAVLNFSGAGNSTLDAGFTSDRKTLTAAIRNPRVSSTGTAIYDAVARAVDEAAGRKEHPMLLLFTDGCNNQGRGVRDAVQYCQKRMVVVIIVGFSGKEGRNDAELRQLALGTGGYYLPSEGFTAQDVFAGYALYSVNKTRALPKGGIK